VQNAKLKRERQITQIFAEKIFEQKEAKGAKAVAGNGAQKQTAGVSPA
jgi:hypothetical protein